MPRPGPLPLHDPRGRDHGLTTPSAPGGAAPAADVVLDLRGLWCPHPVLRAKRALRDLPVGAALLMECTDPLTVIDVPHFANQTGHVLATQERRGELFLFRLVKSPPKAKP